MTRGRKPKPTAKKKLEGNPGKRALNKREPKRKITRGSTPTKPAAPVAVASTANEVDGAAIEAMYKGFCDRYAPLLTNLHLLAEADHAEFELMATHYAIARRAAEIALREGLLSLDKFQQAHKHPALQILRDNSALFKSYAANFGMSPSDLARLDVADDEEIDPLERELFGPPIRAARAQAETHE